MSSSPTMVAEIAELDAGHVPVVLIAGQSNAVGLALVSAAPDVPGANSWLYTGVAYEGSTPDLWDGIADTNGTRFGPEWGMSTDYNPVAVVKHAVGATNLYSDWQPGGSTYEDFEDTAIAALAEFTACGVPYSIKALVWVQGETDAASTQVNAEAYAENLAVMVADFRAQWGAGIKVIVVELKTTAGDWDATVRTEEATFVAGDGNAALIDTDALTTSDGTHYDTASMFTLGELIAAEIP